MRIALLVVVALLWPADAGLPRASLAALRALALAEPTPPPRGKWGRQPGGLQHRPPTRLLSGDEIKTLDDLFPLPTEESRALQQDLQPQRDGVPGDQPKSR